MSTRALEARLWRIAGQVLTEKQWEAFELRYRHHLTEADIAHHLGVTRQAVSDRLRKAAQRIHAHEQQTRSAA